MMMLAIMGLAIISIEMFQRRTYEYQGIMRTMGMYEQAD